MEKTRPENKPIIDPDFSPKYPGNIEAARKRDWRFDATRGVYVDADGCMVADRFGQPF
jgi:hypothetical protein